jgi:hypothetical protein
MASLSFWLGTILVVWWAIHDFESPHAFGYVRDRTDFGRYVLGLTVFSLSMWMMYVLIWILARVIAHDYDLNHVVAISSAIVLMVALPHLPKFANIVVWMRNFAQSLAGFPTEAADLAMSMRRPTESYSDQVVQNLDAEIQSCGFSFAQMKEIFSQSAVASVLEAERINRLLMEYSSLDQGPGRPEALQLHDAKSLRLYLTRRELAIQRLRADYAQLIRRAARLIKLALDQPLSKRQLKQLSAFLADGAESLVAKSQRLVAEAALGAIPAKRRRKFLETFGYAVSKPLPSLPVWPIVAVLGIDICTSGTGFAVIGLLSYAKHNGSTGLSSTGLASSSDIVNGLVQTAPIIFAHGLAMTTAVFWSIAPRVLWAWSRPGVVKGASSPIASYIVFGAVSYACGVLFFAAGINAFDTATNQTGQFSVLAMLLLPPGLFAVTNVVLAMRIDRRITSSVYKFGSAAVRDAAWLWAATLAYSVFFRTMATFVFNVPHLPPIWLIWPILSITAIIIGLAIPGWAVFYIYPPRVHPFAPGGNQTGWPSTLVSSTKATAASNVT